MVNAACVEGEALQLLCIFICSFTTAATLLCVYTNVSSHECHTHLMLVEQLFFGLV